jgi:hypothetical protein
VSNCANFSSCIESKRVDRQKDADLNSHQQSLMPDPVNAWTRPKAPPRVTGSERGVLIISFTSTLFRRINLLSLPGAIRHPDKEGPLPIPPEVA